MCTVYVLLTCVFCSVRQIFIQDFVDILFARFIFFYYLVNQMCCMSFSCLYSMKFLKMMKSKTLWASFKQIMLHSPVIYIFTYLFSMILGLFFTFLVQLVLISKSPKIHKNFTHQINKIGRHLAEADSRFSWSRICSKQANYLLFSFLWKTFFVLLWLCGCLFLFIWTFQLFFAMKRERVGGFW